MSNSGSLVILLIVFGCIIGGAISITVGSYIESEEGLNITINESTPEGKAFAVPRNFLFGLGAITITKNLCT